MRAFLEFSELVDQADIEGRTAFMWAAGAGALETLDVMLDCGVDLSQSDKNGATGENEMTVLEMTCQNRKQNCSGSVSEPTVAIRRWLPMADLKQKLGFLKVS